MKNQHCYNFLEPILATTTTTTKKKKQKNKKNKKTAVHLARHLRGNWTNKFQSIFSCELECSHHKGFWIQLFLKVTHNLMISGLLEDFDNVSSGNNT